MPAPRSAPPVALLVDGRPVGPAELAADRRARARGLLGRDGIVGVLVLPATTSVHTIGMRFALDVALCTTELEVIAVRTVAPGRLLLPRRRVGTVVEAAAGSFARWGLAPGSQLALR